MVDWSTVEKLYDCDDLMYDIERREVLFACGLIIAHSLLKQVGEWEIGIINSVHMRHHELGHTENPWTATFHREDTTDLGRDITSWCDCPK